MCYQLLLWLQPCILSLVHSILSAPSDKTSIILLQKHLETWWCGLMPPVSLFQFGAEKHYISTITIPKITYVCVWPMAIAIDIFYPIGSRYSLGITSWKQQHLLNPSMSSLETNHRNRTHQTETTPTQRRRTALQLTSIDHVNLP